MLNPLNPRFKKNSHVKARLKMRFLIDFWMQLSQQFHGVQLPESSRQPVRHGRKHVHQISISAVVLHTTLTGLNANENEMRDFNDCAHCGERIEHGLAVATFQCQHGMAPSYQLLNLWCACDVVSGRRQRSASMMQCLLIIIIIKN